MSVSLIFLFLLMPQNSRYLWVPDLSVRTQLLSYLSPGVVRDGLTDIFLNPAYSGDAVKSRLYLSHHGTDWEPGYGDPRSIRSVLITSFGLSLYARTKMYHQMRKLADLADKRMGVMYGLRVGGRKLGVGYSYSYSEQSSYYGTPLSDLEGYSLSLGGILRDRTNMVISFSKHDAEASSEVEKTIINGGIGTGDRVRNYLSVAYTSYIDESFHCEVCAFDRLATALVSSGSSEIHIIGQVEYRYTHRPPAPMIEMDRDDRVAFRLGINVEQLVGNVSLMGSFSQHIGYGACADFVFMSAYPVCMGISVLARPLQLWVMVSPRISDCSRWNMELSYVFDY